MNKKIKFAFLAVFLFGMVLSSNSTLTTANATAEARVFTPGGTFLLDIGHDNTHSYDYNALTAYLIESGFDVVVLGTGDAGSGVFTADVLADVDAMLLPAPFSSSGAYTAAELAAVEAWWATGNKSAWIGGDSDYGPNNNPVIQGNAMLETLGASIYLETGYVDDPDCNIDGGTYRPLATNFATHDLTTDVGPNGVLFHGPVPVMGYNGTDYVALEDPANVPANVEVIVQANETAYYNKLGGLEGYEVHEISTYGNFCLFAVEEFPADDNRIVVSGEAIFTEWKGMFPAWNGTHYIEEKGYVVDNFYLINNTLHWMATPGGYPGGLYYEFSPATVTSTVTNEVNVTVVVTEIESVIETTTETEAPGFLAFVAILPLVGIGYLFVRRRR